MNSQFSKQALVGGVVLLFVVGVLGMIFSPRPKESPAPMTASDLAKTAEAPAKSPLAGQPLASAAAKATHSAWKITRSKNPITGEVSEYAITPSTKKIYNPFSVEEFEKVELVVTCSEVDQPEVMLWTHNILTADAVDVYQGSIRIDEQIIPVAWRIEGSEKEIMTAIPNDIAQKFQTGKSVIVSFRALKSGQQSSLFSLTGLRTTMDKMNCPNLTR